MIATFFLSAGRCGTQTLHRALAELRPDAVVEHEPIGADYRYFDRAMSHLRDIEAVLGRCDYIETGWPCMASIPRYRALLGDRMQVIAIKRDVKAQARSLRAHDLFGGRSDDFARLMLADNAEDHIAAVHALPSDATVKFEDMFRARPRAAGLAALVGVDPTALAGKLRRRVDRWPTHSRLGADGR